jgi:uncharacterized protein (DUF885 family)
MYLRALSITALSLALVACGDDKEKSAEEAAGTSETEVAAEVETESQRLNAFLEAVFQEGLARSPTSQSFLGIKTDYDKWDDISEARAQEDNELTQKYLRQLSEFDFDLLDEKTKLSYRLFKQIQERDIAQFRFRDHNYPVNQMFGWHTNIPSFLINIHRITSLEDAEAYVARLNGVKPLLGEVIVGLKRRQEAGIMPPQFAYPLVLQASRNVLNGAPFEAESDDGTLLADFRKKVAGLEIEDEQKAALLGQAEEALLNSVRPAYEELITFLAQQSTVATTDDGVWKLPNGDEFYTSMLANYTSTELTASEIHDLGLANVERIHNEMRQIMEKVGFEGSLNAFFDFMREDEQFYYPNSDEGRAEYLEKAVAIIETMKQQLPDFFSRFPKADLVVKRVEPFRERSAGKAFYQRPALDGSRPGTYYANLADMKDMPSYQMEALAYHEGIPGHHMQLAISQELEDLPQFQKFARFTAYTEGWGLYSEYLAKDMGFYEDPYSDFGRLAMELWRACRLVVDTGLHDKKWTREQAMQYLTDNTPNPEGDIEAAINRYIVFAGQATAYMVGKIKILELREWARAELGENFDVRRYHDEVLRHGPVPLDILEENVGAWVTSAKTE